MIFIDIGLPDLSGFEVASKIKYMQSENKNVPIIGVTAHFDTDNPAATKTNVFDAIYNKPMTADFFDRVIAQFLLKIPVTELAASVAGWLPELFSPPYKSGVCAINC